MKRLAPLGTMARLGPLPEPAGAPPPPLPDLDILVALYGHNLYRAEAVARTFRNWDRCQAPMPRVLCAYCYREGSEPEAFADLRNYAWLVLVRLPQYDIDDGVFRKEGLLNHLLREHATAPYILTIDTDVWCAARQWFRKVRDKLAEDPDHVFQPWARFRDTGEPKSSFATSARALERWRGKVCGHPGLGWAFSRAWAARHPDMAVFNPWYVTGSGDCVFVEEHFHLRKRHSDAPLYRLPETLRRELREVPPGTLAGIDVDVRHSNHTDRSKVPARHRGDVFADRAYFWAGHALDQWGGIRQYIFLDSDGVPVLRDPDGPFAGFLFRRVEIQSRESANRIIAECLGVGAPARAPAVKPAFPPSGDVVLSTEVGIGDHLMMLAVARGIRRRDPKARIAVKITRPGLEPWFRTAVPGIEFTDRPGMKIPWLKVKAIPGRHIVETYGATAEDMWLPRPERPPRDGGPRIAFVGEHNPMVPLKTWPHWERLAELVRARYGVAPIRLGQDVVADPIHTLPALLASMDVVVCTEGMASHLCWAIRKRAIVILGGAFEPTAIAHPGWHTILQGRCPHGRHCHQYTNGRRPAPACRAECMADIRPETVLEAMQRPRRMVNVHYISPNCGDANCGVARYFPGIEERHTGAPPVPCDVAIFGGGALYHPSVLAVARRYQHLGARIVIWGAGVTTEDRAEGMTASNWREFGDMAGLCGLREPSPWHLVPCPTCMSPFFDEMCDIVPEHEVVYYNHPDKPVRGGEPRMTNADTTDLAIVLRFLASGRRVVTSSYHGRIWATWLGREVELDGPAADQLAASGDIPPLAAARAANRSFHERMLSLVWCGGTRP